MPAELSMHIGPKRCTFTCNGQCWQMEYGSGQVISEHIVSDPPLPEELSAALSVVELYVDDLKRSDFFSTVSSTSTITLGGEGLELAAVEVGDSRMAAEMVGHKITIEALEEVFRCLVTESQDQRKHNPGLSEPMVNSILGVSVIAVEVARQLEVEELVVGELELDPGVKTEEAS